MDPIRLQSAEFIVFLVGARGFELAARRYLFPVPFEIEKPYFPFRLRPGDDI
jgi:hypothetical protein